MSRLKNARATEKVFRAIVATARRLTRFPEIGRPGRLPRTREFPLTALPYLIVYEVGIEAITIVAVFHTSRDLTRALVERKFKL